MDTSNLKKFATLARTNLLKGVLERLKYLGFDDSGHVQEQPELVHGGAIFRGNIVSSNFYKQWHNLERAINTHHEGPKVGIKHVAEEAAYTWFNRLIAIRILQKNGLIEPQLTVVNKTPLIVDNARHGRLPPLTNDERAALDKIIDDDSKDFEQFAILIVAFCHATPILAKCFGRLYDYSELLLPANILKDGGFISLLNTTDYITEEDFKQTELIGWLYQFYISEKKDEVFASFKNKKKAEVDDIPAATQIFTPNWIVKYMVQNTLGRIYLDNNKGSDLSTDWKYLVEKSDNSGEIYKYTNLEDLKVADFACGSGHILNEFFDMLYSFYMEDAYSSSEAIESIFKNNMIGIDLDTRAKQLSMFSLLLKACQKNKKFVDAKVLPRVYDMPEPITDNDWLNNTLSHYFTDSSDRVIKESLEALELMKSAKNLGSIMVFKISTETRNAIAEHIDIWDDKEEEQLQNLVKSFQIILALTGKYSAISMNPPYMGNGNMNTELSGYVKDNYPNSKADLFSVFMDVCIDRLENNAKYGMINMHSWMFLSSFENLRTDLLKNYLVDNMLHLGPRTFDELGGEVVQNSAYVVTKTKKIDATGTYFRLVEGKDCSSKEQMFLDSKKKKDINDKIYYPNVPQSNYAEIPGSPIGYWVCENVRKIFQNKTIGEIAAPRQGLATSDNNRFLRLWFEPSNNNISYNSSTRLEALESGCKWFPYNKGGSFRKWYGNNEFIINWAHDGQELLAFAASLYGSPTRTIKNINYYFQESITWSALSCSAISLRYSPVGFLFDTKGQCIFTENKESKLKLMGFLNSKISNELLKIIAPTLDFNSGTVAKLPFINIEINISSINICVDISKSDWDAHETSWDFQKNELLAMDTATDDENVAYGEKMAVERYGLNIENAERVPQQPNLLEWRMDVYESKWERLFYQLHDNEVELNRQFIEIYGLQDELTPDVPLDEVTILQQGEIEVFGDRIEFNRDVIIKQFVSYAVGCMMGRYRLDKPGLAIAHPNATAEETAAYACNGETWQIDDDGILPLMSKESSFTDNAVNRFTEFLRVALGSESLTENLNFVETCLGKSIEDYFAKDFWNDHKKMYQNRPIYWLFSSKKGAFKCLAYMHRMDRYTAELVRKNYLLPHIEYLKNRVSELEQNQADLSSADRKKLAAYRKNYEECLEYEGRLQQVAAAQIAFDLDDGVVVNYAKFGDILAKIK